MNPDLPTFILDACVGAKWLHREEMSQKADLFLHSLAKREIRIVVPEIFYAELASLCVKRVRRKIISIDEAALHLDQVASFPLETYSDQELSDVALENALRFGVSVYDGLYLALAEIYVAPLVTADKQLLKACRGRFDFIESLEEAKL